MTSKYSVRGTTTPVLRVPGECALKFIPLIRTPGTDLGLLCQRFDAFFHEAPLDCMRWLFYIGDVALGVRNEDYFLCLLHYAAIHFTIHMLVNLQEVPYYGLNSDYDAFFGTPLENAMLQERFLYPQLDSEQRREGNAKKQIDAGNELSDFILQNMAQTVPECMVGWAKHRKVCEAIYTKDNPFELAAEALEDEDDPQWLETKEDSQWQVKWNLLPSYNVKGLNILVMGDSSDASGEPLAYYVGTSLYFAERNHGHFKNIIYSLDNCQIRRVEGNTSLMRLQSVKDMQTGETPPAVAMESALYSLLDMAIEGGFHASEQPNALLMITSREFSLREFKKLKASLQAAANCYRAYGLILPNLILWNAVSSNPLLLHDDDFPEVFCISGRHTFCRVLTAIVYKNTVWEYNRLVVSAPRYNRIRDFAPER